MWAGAWQQHCARHEHTASDDTARGGDHNTAIDNRPRNDAARGHGLGIANTVVPGRQEVVSIGRVRRMQGRPGGVNIIVPLRQNGLRGGV